MRRAAQPKLADGRGRRTVAPRKGDTHAERHPSCDQHCKLGAPEPRLLYGDAGPASGQENRQLRRPRLLSLVLRRCGRASRHDLDLLRMGRRGAWPARDRRDAGDRLQHSGRLDRLLDPAPDREGRRPRSPRQALRRNNDRVQGSRRDPASADRRQGRRGQARMERKRRARGTFHSRLPQREPAAG